MRPIRALLPFLLCLAAPALAQAGPVASDPAADAANPAGQDAFVMPVAGSGINALIYTASGAQPHPMLILLHGFPGNEQNLDLAQAARRDGWNVLTLHYRGSWGSGGAFTFGGAAADAHAAIAFLRDSKIVAKYHIDSAKIALAGHSMGGFMAADAAADDPRVIGLFLIDAWNIADAARKLTPPAAAPVWRTMAAEDLPPLAGTSADALRAEMIGNIDRFDLLRRIAAYGKRPLAVYGAARGNGDANLGYMQTSRNAGNSAVTGAIWATDHPFSDKRIALSQALVTWLDSIAPPQSTSGH